MALPSLHSNSVEGASQRLDEHLGHLHLAVRHVDVVEPGQLLDLVDGDDLIGVGQRRHHQPALVGAERGGVLAAAHHEPHDRHLAG